MDGQHSVARPGGAGAGTLVGAGATPWSGGVERTVATDTVPKQLVVSWREMTSSPKGESFWTVKDALSALAGCFWV